MRNTATIYVETVARGLRKKASQELIKQNLRQIGVQNQVLDETYKTIEAGLRSGVLFGTTRGQSSEDCEKRKSPLYDAAFRKGVWAYRKEWTAAVFAKIFGAATDPKRKPMQHQNTEPLGISQQLTDLLFAALDHGVDSVRGGGNLVPFVLYQRGKERLLDRYVADTLEDSLRQARRAASSLPPDVSSYAIAYAGLITLTGKKQDAIMVEAGERGRPQGVKFAQRYSPKKILRKFQAIGNPLSLGMCNSAF